MDLFYIGQLSFIYLCESHQQVLTILLVTSKQRSTFSPILYFLSAPGEMFLFMASRTLLQSWKSSSLLVQVWEFLYVPSDKVHLQIELKILEPYPKRAARGSIWFSPRYNSLPLLQHLVSTSAKLMDRKILLFDRFALAVCDIVHRFRETCVP